MRTSRTLIALLVVLTVSIALNGLFINAYVAQKTPQPSLNLQAFMFKMGQGTVDPAIIAVGWTYLPDAPQGLWYYQPSAQAYQFRYQYEIGGGIIPDATLAQNGWVVSHQPFGIWYGFNVHNTLTNCFADFFQDQIASTSGIGTNGANYIALTNNNTMNNQDDCSMQGEITGTGLQRQQGTVTKNQSAISSGDVTFRVAKTFTATGAVSAEKAGLTPYTTASCPAGLTKPNGCMVAVGDIATASLQNTDTLSVTWDVSFNGS